MDYTDRLRAAPSAAALNRLLQAAGSRAWLQRSGKLWQPMIDDYVDGFAGDFETCRTKIVDAFEMALLAGEVTPPEPPAKGRRPKADADVAKNRPTRWKDSDWAAVKRIGMKCVRELVRAEDARQARAKAAGGPVAGRSPAG